MFLAELHGVEKLSPKIEWRTVAKAKQVKNSFSKTLICFEC